MRVFVAFVAGLVCACGVAWAGVSIGVNGDGKVHIVRRASDGGGDVTVIVDKSATVVALTKADGSVTMTECAAGDVCAGK